MKIAIFLFVLSSATSAMAAPKKPCPGFLGVIHGTSSEKEKVTKATYTFAKAALAHYRSNQLGGYNNRPYIDSYSVYYGEHEEVTGYKIGLTDGGDESYTTYYFDYGGKLVYAKYSNQSPIGYWFCGQSTALEVNL